MKLWRWLIAGGLCAAALLTAFLLWQLPTKQDMARAVPAETLVYLEANDLPQVLRALTETEAWRELAPVYEIERDYGQFGSFSQTLAQLNIGSTETVIFGRSQVAVALLGVGARDGAEGSLSIRPQYAVVIETKSGRAGNLVNNQIADFARRQFGEVKTEKKNSDGAEWTIFRATADERNLFAAVAGTTAVIGNEEAAVQACLDVKSGKRKSLIDDENLAKMRANTEADAAFAFGYVTPEGVKHLSNIGAVIAAGQLAEDPRAMSLLAQSLPPFLQKTVTAIGWTARKNVDRIEDRFFVQMPPDLVSRLREPLAASSQTNSNIADFLPYNTNSFTIYNLKNPRAAWRGLILATMNKLDTVSAAIFSQAAGGLFEPYGVKNADEFLGTLNGEIVTVRSGVVDGVVSSAIVETNDVEQTQKNLQKPGVLIGKKLMFGSEPPIQDFVEAYEQKKNIGQVEIWKDINLTPSDSVFVRTFDKDYYNPSYFVAVLAKDKKKDVNVNFNSPIFRRYSETRLMREGFERRIYSPFGFISTLALNLSAQ